MQCWKDIPQDTVLCVMWSVECSHQLCVKEPSKPLWTLVTPRATDGSPLRDMQCWMDIPQDTALYVMWSMECSHQLCVKESSKPLWTLVTAVVRATVGSALRDMQCWMDIPQDTALCVMWSVEFSHRCVKESSKSSH
jgi:hypothetical protein